MLGVMTALEVILGVSTRMRKQIVLCKICFYALVLNQPENFSSLTGKSAEASYHWF